MNQDQQIKWTDEDMKIALAAGYGARVMGDKLSKTLDWLNGYKEIKLQQEPTPRIEEIGIDEAADECARGLSIVKLCDQYIQKIILRKAFKKGAQWRQKSKEEEIKKLVELADKLAIRLILENPNPSVELKALLADTKAALQPYLK